MKINLSRPLASYLTREIKKGDIIWALLWANEYRENDPYFVQALYTLAKNTGRVNTINPELQKQLLNGHVITNIGSPLPETRKLTGRKPRAPSLETLELRFTEKSLPVKSANSK